MTTIQGTSRKAHQATIDITQSDVFIIVLFVEIDEKFIITFINKRLSIRLISFELNTSARELGT